MARIEHFALGVNTGIYDVEIAERAGTLFLRSLYKGKLKPLIETKSKGNSNIEYYAEFRKFNVISLAWPNIVENRIFSIDTEYNDINKYKGTS